MHTFFRVELESTQSCEVFLVEGVPAASMVYEVDDGDGAPIVQAFYLNKAMLLLFDAASLMRRLLRERHDCLDMHAARNRNEFFFFP